jgi:osmotically-inducible protein OsmY
MGETAAYLILPARDQVAKRKDAVEATAALLLQSVEDLRLAECVQRALRATGRGPLRRIDVSVCAGVVILTGRVPRYFFKQLAQATALAVPEVTQLHNELEVAPADRSAT